MKGNNAGKEGKGMNKETSMAVTRLAVAIILMANTMLTAAGKNPVPFDEAAFTEWLAYAASGLSAFWAWWKNNNVTVQAQEAQKSLKERKQDGDGSDGAVFGETEESGVKSCCLIRSSNIS